MKSYFFIVIIVLLPLFFGCQTQEKKHISNDQKEIITKHNEVVFCSDKAKELGFRTTITQPTTFQQVIKTGGKVMTAQGKKVTISATISGVVSLSNSLVEGVKVNSGTLLAILSSKNTTEGEPFEKARITFNAAKKEYNRAKPLANKQIISEKEFSIIKQAYDEAHLAFEAMKKNSSPQGQNVLSPIQGFVKTIWVNEGDYITMGQPIATVTQTQELYLRAEVAERYYDQLPYITTANFKAPYNKECYALKDLNGKLLSTGKTSKDEANFIPITFSFENKGNIIPGSYMEVFLLSHPLPNQYVVPTSALIEEQGLFNVYIKQNEETYIKKEVQLGMNNGLSVQILKGLELNDEVVTQGAPQLKLASTSSSIPAHTHDH